MERKTEKLQLTITLSERSKINEALIKTIRDKGIPHTMSSFLSQSIMEVVNIILNEENNA